MSERELIALLRQTDAACPSCGYNLRGIDRAQCPECGRSVTAARLLHRAADATGAWTITLIAWSASLPQSWLKWQRLIVRRRFFYGRDTEYFAPLEPVELMMGAASYAFWLAVPWVVVGLAVGRARMRRWPMWLKWTAAGGSVVLAVLAHRRFQFWWYWTAGSRSTALWELWFLQ